MELTLFGVTETKTETRKRAERIALLLGRLADSPADRRAIHSNYNFAVYLIQKARTRKMDPNDHDGLQRNVGDLSDLLTSKEAAAFSANQKNWKPLPKGWPPAGPCPMRAMPSPCTLKRLPTWKTAEENGGFSYRQCRGLTGRSASAELHSAEISARADDTRRDDVRTRQYCRIPLPCKISDDIQSKHNQHVGHIPNTAIELLGAAQFPLLGRNRRPSRSPSLCLGNQLVKALRQGEMTAFWAELEIPSSVDEYGKLPEGVQHFRGCCNQFSVGFIVNPDAIAPSDAVSIRAMYYNVTLDRTRLPRAFSVFVHFRLLPANQAGFRLTQDNYAKWTNTCQVNNHETITASPGVTST